MNWATARTCSRPSSGTSRDAARPGQTNRLDLEMKVATVSEALSYSSAYAFHNLGGIDRSVRLFALPATYVREMRVNAVLDKDYRDGMVTLHLVLAGGDEEGEGASLPAQAPSWASGESVDWRIRSPSPLPSPRGEGEHPPVGRLTQSARTFRGSDPGAPSPRGEGRGEGERISLAWTNGNPHKVLRPPGALSVLLSCRTPRARESKTLLLSPPSGPSPARRRLISSPMSANHCSGARRSRTCTG